PCAIRHDRPLPQRLRCGAWLPGLPDRHILPVSSPPSQRLWVRGRADTGLLQIPEHRLFEQPVLERESPLCHCGEFPTLPLLLRPRLRLDRRPWRRIGEPAMFDIDFSQRRRCLDHLAAAIGRTPLATEPFPHFIVRGFFPADVYSALLDLLPWPASYAD